MKAWRVASAGVAVAVVAGCAPLTSLPESAPVDREALSAPFFADGRLSARRANDGIAGQFAWRHEATHDRIDLTSPVGQTIARLDGDADGVRIETQNGRVESARDWDSLTSRTLGITIPVGGLSAWLRGLPSEGSRYTLERDAQNRPLLLRQDGWEIAYAYAGPDASRASRVTLRYPGAEPIEVRIVVDRWQ